LNQAAFAFRATHGAVKDPEREGKQHEQEEKERYQRLAHLCETLPFD
jgi:hypothetical protein